MFFRFGSVLIGVAVISGLVFFRWHSFVDRSTPAHFIKRSDKPIPAYQMEPEEGIAFPVFPSDSSFKLVTRQIYNQKPFLENTHDQSYILSTKMLSRDGRVRHQRDFYESVSQFSQLEDSDSSSIDTISDGFNPLWLSDVRLTTILLDDILPDGGEIQVSLHKSSHPILLQAFKRSDPSSEQPDIKNIRPSSRTFHNISQRLQIESLYELNPRDYQKVLLHLWMYTEGRPIGNHKLISRRIHSNQLSKRNGLFDQSSIGIPPGKTLALNLMGPLLVDIRSTQETSPTTLFIETLHTSARQDDEIKIQPINLQSETTHLVDIPEGALTLNLHNPNQHKLLLSVSANAKDYAPIDPNKAIIHHIETDRVFLSPEIRKFHSYWISPGDHETLELTALGFSEQDLIRMEVRAIISSQCDSNTRTLDITSLDGFGRVITQNRASFRPRASLFESFQTPTSKPNDFISDPAAFFIQPKQKAERIRVASKYDLLVRFFYEPSRYMHSSPLYPPHSIDRRWRYAQSNTELKIPILPDTGDPSTYQRVKIVAQSRLEPKKPPSSIPTIPSPWKTLPTTQTSRYQVLFEQIDAASHHKHSNNQGFWCRLPAGKSTFLTLPPDTINPRKGLFDAIVHIPAPNMLGGAISVSFNQNKLPGRKPVTRVETHRVRNLPERQGVLQFDYHGASSSRPPEIWIRSHNQKPSRCLLYKAFNVTQLQPGERLTFPINKPVNLESVIRIGAYSAHPVDFDLLLDQGKPKRINDLVLPSRSLSRKRVQPDWRLPYQHAWTKTSPASKIKATKGVFMHIRNDLGPGKHQLILFNKGKGPIWVRASQRIKPAKAPGGLEKHITDHRGD